VADGKGGQTVKDTGPLTKKRMETIDEEITAKALDWMEKQAKANKPFFLWYNSTAMHLRTHLAAKNRGKSGQDDYSDRMVTHDEQIGQMLDKLDELGIADNTIVMYSTDNGPENDTWPDGANTPYRSQKDTNWEGAWRVPAFFRWPGRIKAGSVLNGIGSHQDMLPTLLAVFAEQRAISTAVWAEPMVKLRLPLIFNLRRDPFERAQHNSNVYYDWLIDHVPQLYACQALVESQIQNFVKYPPRQKAASFNLDAVMAQLGGAIQAERAEAATKAKKPELTHA
jgi:arylsulfatase A-like enzyme